MIVVPLLITPSVLASAAAAAVAGGGSTASSSSLSSAANGAGLTALPLGLVPAANLSSTSLPDSTHDSASLQTPPQNRAQTNNNRNRRLRTCPPAGPPAIEFTLPSSILSSLQLQSVASSITFPVRESSAVERSSASATSSFERLVNAASRASPLTIASDDATIHEHDNISNIGNDIDNELKASTTAVARATACTQTEAVELQETRSPQRERLDTGIGTELDDGALAEELKAAAEETLPFRVPQLPNTFRSISPEPEIAAKAPRGRAVRSTRATRAQQAARREAGVECSLEQSETLKSVTSRRRARPQGAAAGQVPPPKRRRTWRESHTQTAAQALMNATRFAQQPTRVIQQTAEALTSVTQLSSATAAAQSRVESDAQTTALIEEIEQFLV